MDNCWDYNDGASEVRMGKALRDGYRQKVFLMTKIDGRTKSRRRAARRVAASACRPTMSTCSSSTRSSAMNDPDRIFAPGRRDRGGWWRAKKAGKVRFIGFTGHKSPEIHLRMLEAADAHGFRFDTVQMPLNVMDAHYESFEKVVLPVALERADRRAGHEADGRPASSWRARPSPPSSACATP